MSANFIPRQLQQLTDSAGAPLPDISSAEMGTLSGVTAALQTQLNGKYGSGDAILGTSFTIGANTLDANEWTHLDGIDQSLATTDSPTFVHLTVSQVVGINGQKICFDRIANYIDFYPTGSGKLFTVTLLNTVFGNNCLFFQMQASGDPALFDASNSPLYLGTSGSSGGAVYLYTKRTGSAGNVILTLETNGDIVLGSAAAGYDQVLKFSGETNDGFLTWMEDEDYFHFSDDLFMNTTEALYFRDTAIFISSKDDGHLDLDADVSVDLNTPSLRFGTLPPVYATNAAAVTGGLTAGQVYRTGGDPDNLCIVH